MDGVEATLYIRGLDDPYYADLPIVALTANAVSGTRELFLENGFNDFLSKPIETVRLNDIIERWIPRSKQQSCSPARVQPAEDTKQLEISGLDVRKGVALTGGITDRYIEALATFYTDSLEKIDQLRHCLDTGDLQLYTTYVHGMKSAAAIIGADSLSASANALEAAGKSMDAAFIEKNNDEYIQDLEQLLDNIRRVIREEAREYGCDMIAVRSGLVELKSALDDFEAGRMHKAVENLLKLTQSSDLGAVIRKISDSILISEYDEAAALVETLISREGE